MRKTSSSSQTHGLICLFTAESIKISAVKALKSVFPEVNAELKNRREWSKLTEEVLFKIFGKDKKVENIK